jgi:cold-inducible RNA-binding protein
MENKLFVGSLPWSTTSEELRELFAQAGTVESADVIFDKMSGRSKGFGFVVMATNEEAQKAIEMFHEKEFNGRNLVVNVARPKEDRPPRRDFDNGGGRQW